MALACSLLALPAGFAAAPAANGSWSLIEEAFSYPDGLLTDVSGTAWRRQLGNVSITVESQVAIVGPGDGSEGYVTTRFAALGLKENLTAVEARFSLRLCGVPVSGTLERGALGTVLQFTSGDGKQRRGRLFFRTLLDGTYQLGSSGKTTGATVWSSRTFAADTTYAVVLVYEITTGQTRLWIDPDQNGQLGSPVLESINPNLTSPERVSLQVSAQMGPHRLRIDDLVVQPFGEIK